MRRLGRCRAADRCVRHRVRRWPPCLARDTCPATCRRYVYRRASICQAAGGSRRSPVPCVWMVSRVGLTLVAGAMLRHQRPLDELSSVGGLDGLAHERFHPWFLCVKERQQGGRFAKREALAVKPAPALTGSADIVFAALFILHLRTLGWCLLAGSLAGQCGVPQAGCPYRFRRTGRQPCHRSGGFSHAPSAGSHG